MLKIYRFTSEVAQSICSKATTGSISHPVSFPTGQLNEFGPLIASTGGGVAETGGRMCRMLTHVNSAERWLTAMGI